MVFTIPNQNSGKEMPPWARLRRAGSNEPGWEKLTWRDRSRDREGQVRSGLVWGFSCQAVVLGCAESFLFGAGKAVFRPVACNQVPGARGRGQGTETLAELGGLPPSVACVSQRLDA